MEHSADGTATSRHPLTRGFGRRNFLAGAGALAGLGLTASLPGSPAARAETTGSASETSQWRPSVCFTPERNWMNDPNGMVYFKGEYHLFFQHNPYGDQWGNMSWGHAVSTDLVHWKHLPVALEPDELGDIFSGCAVVDHHDTSGLFGGRPGLVALYTSAGDTQQQSLAYSSDRGRSWTKYSGNPVIPNSGEADFRDPKVFWHAATNRWVMSLAVGDRIRFYGSPNLLQWEQLSEFGANHGAHGGVWECPDLFRLPVDGDDRRGKWVLIVSINPGGPAGGSGMQYFLGDFDGTTFTPDAAPDDVLWADEGADFYAAVSWSDVPDGRRLWLGWMSNWSYAADVPTSPWRGGMSAPRELELVSTAAGTRLAQQPVTELERVRRNRRAWSGTVSEQGGAPDTEGTALDVVAEFQLAGATATSFGFDVFANDSYRTRIGYDVTRQELFVDRRSSGRTTVHSSFPARHTVPLPPTDGVLRLRIVLDRANVQVFGDRGQAVITDLVFPDDGSTRASTFAIGGEVTVQALEVFDLDA